MEFHFFYGYGFLIYLKSETYNRFSFYLNLIINQDQFQCSRTSFNFNGYPFKFWGI